MEELEILINFIQLKYVEVSNKWKKDERYQRLNMKNKTVHNIYQDKSLLLYVFNYRDFVNNNTINIDDEIHNFEFNNTINTRIKALNSIQDKIEKYEIKKESGKIPIKKCLNDIFGFRIILDTDNTYDDIKKYVKKKFPKLKCIESFKEQYKAVHVYFGNDDNMKFQWELQIWNKEDEKTNLISHAKHKQEYTKWEKEKIEVVI